MLKSNRITAQVVLGVLSAFLGIFSTAASEVCASECILCVPLNGGAPTVDCTPRPETRDLPPEVLADPDLAELEPLHRYAGQAVLDHWEAVLAPVFDVPDRVYLPRHAATIGQEYPLAPYAQIHAAAAARFRADLVHIYRNAFVESVPDGLGGREWHLRSRDVLGAFVLRLLRGVGAFDPNRLEELALGSPSLALVEAPLSGFEEFRLFHSVLPAVSPLRREASEAIFDQPRRRTP